MEPIYLDTPEYIVELWDINGVFVADVTALVATSLRITMPLNDVDEVSFSLDLVQFEELCESINVRPLNILEPYRTDVKIRRNGQYLVGAHVVDTKVNFNSESTNKIEIACTGYLNHLKDRYLTANYSNMTYAQIARQLITDTQASYNLITNSNFYEGIRGWQYIDAGYVLWSSTEGRTSAGSLFASVSTGAVGYGGARWQHALQAGLTYTLSFWVKPVTGSGSVYIAVSGNTAMATTPVTNTAGWTFVTHTWTHAANSSNVDIKMTNNTNFFLDDVKLSDNVDSTAVRNFGITLGTDTASPSQAATRVRNYDLQNVKDGIINLTKLENDKFDFSFDANKVFKTYARKGSDKPDIELVYPQNIKTINTSRSAQTLANKIFALGSGIGDERIETSVLDLPSATSYRVRETTELFNSVINMPVLAENAIGVLEQKQGLYETIEVTVNNNVLDLDLIEVGDAIYIRIDKSTYVDYVNGLYRITQISIDVSQEFDENITLELEKWE